MIGKKLLPLVLYLFVNYVLPISTSINDSYNYG